MYPAMSLRSVQLRFRYVLRRGVFTTRRYTNPRLPYLTLPSQWPRTVVISLVFFSRDVKVSRPAWSRDHFSGLGLGLGFTVIGLGLGFGLMR